MQGKIYMLPRCRTGDSSYVVISKLSECDMRRWDRASESVVGMRRSRRTCLKSSCKPRNKASAVEIIGVVVDDICVVAGQNDSAIMLPRPILVAMLAAVESQRRSLFLDR